MLAEQAAPPQSPSALLPLGHRWPDVSVPLGRFGVALTASAAAGAP